MAQISVWLVAGVMLCSIPACSLGGDMPCIHSLEKGKIFGPLGQLKSIPSHLCLNDRTDFQFPWESRNITEMQKTRCTCLHHLMLQQIFNLFSTNKSPAAWKHTLNKLLSSLDHSLDRLEQTKEETLVCPEDLGSLVRNYFLRIRNYLKKKKHSSCAWEVVRSEIQVCLFLM
ncbi:PREDICTED: interferon alpha-2-like [Hipposideros armiger]|uniref:Interferon alpha-2-like n=1 Tax=Hipposideros armiger TaxID=186990 RepID=A0A8B7Q879_HIPAR|nr:PREDICTED: interferon alpha-2-like [Hipposideros armiger]